MSLADMLNRLIAELNDIVKDIFDFTKGVVIGFFEGLGEAIAGLIHMIEHPIDTLEGLVNVVINYDKTWDAIKQGFNGAVETLKNGTPEEKGKIVGRTLEFVAEFFVGAELAKAVEGG